MTGKTHLAIAACCTALALVASGIGVEGSFLTGMPDEPLPTSARAGAAGAAGANSLTAETLPGGPQTLSLLMLACLLAVGIVGGLFPDLDAPDTELTRLPGRVVSGAGRAARLLSGRRSPIASLISCITLFVALPIATLINLVGAVIRRFTTHRGFTHTLWGMLLFTAMAAGLVFLLARNLSTTLYVTAAWATGYASHLLADACTPAGIPLFGAKSRSLWSVSQAPGGTQRNPHVRRRKDRLNQPAGLRNSAGRSEMGANSLRGRVDGQGYPRRLDDSLIGRTASVSSLGNIHLLPARLRITTGTWQDRVVLRWGSWLLAGIALLAIFSR
jgi:membrane-bound metal-dependent hydrolase YbcI (DUF457 family)